MPKFQNASIGGKISIAWDELIVNPFSKWWDSKGRPAIVKRLLGLEKILQKLVETGSRNLLRICYQAEIKLVSQII